MITTAVATVFLSDVWGCGVSFSPFQGRPHINTKRQPGEREVAIFDENRRAIGMLKPMRDENEGHVPGGTRDDFCNHGLPRRSLRVKPPTRHELS